MPYTSCPACGNNPTSHRVAWYTQSFLIITSPLQTIIGKSWLRPVFNRLADWLITIMHKILLTLGVITAHTNKKSVAGLRGQVLWEEAERRGIPIKSFLIAGRPTDRYETRVHGKTFLFTGLPRPQTTRTDSEWWVDDKAILKQKLLKAGIPAPRGASFSRFAPLLAFFETLSKPVIIKPRQGSRGRHTTTHITNARDLEQAFILAKKLCHWVMVEEYLFGSIYRGTVIDGKLVGVLRGDFPTVSGDGVSNIAELVVKKNTNRPTGIAAITMTGEHTDFLARQGYTVTDIPATGTTIPLLGKVGVAYGGNAVEMTPLTHPRIKEILEAAAKVVGDPIIGFDFIIGDVTRSPDEQRWGIIECNGLPFINLHHSPAEGTPNNVAKYVWDWVEKNVELF